MTNHIAQINAAAANEFTATEVFEMIVDLFNSEPSIDGDGNICLNGYPLSAEKIEKLVAFAA